MAALGPADIGRVVTMRTVTGGTAADVVGTLVALTPTQVTVRRRDGRTVSIDVSDVTHARVVPPGPAQRIDPLELHQVMAQGWRAPEQATAGGWLLRGAGGFTRRANSALPLVTPPPPGSLAVVEDWYAVRGLPARVQVPATPAFAELDGELAAAGWTSDSRAHVMTSEIGPVLRLAPAAAVEVALDDAPDDAWLATYRQDSGPLPEVARALLTNHPAVVFASIREDGECRAIARASVDGRWAGLFAVEVQPPHRRRGLGRAVSFAALQWAARHGARRCYLQTSDDNDSAIALYRSLGYDVHHDYRHWVRK